MKLPTIIIIGVSTILLTGVRGFAPVSPSCSSTSIATIRTNAASSSYSKLAVTADNDALLDALTQTVDAATRAASASSQIAQSLSSTTTSSAPLMTSEAITTAQSNLDILHQNLLTSSDPSTLSNALHEALQTSITAADHALATTSVLSYNLAHFDSILATSIHNAHPFASVMTPEMAEISQANLALLLHNLSGVNVNDHFLTNFMSHVDSRLDGLDSVGDSNMVLFGAAAVVMAYSQREVGVANYKEELRRKIELGEFDADELVKEVSLSGTESNEASVTAMDLTFSKDPAIVTTADASPLFQHREKADEPELIVATAAVTEADAVPKPPTEDIPMESLLKQVEEVAVNTMASVVETVTKKKTVDAKKIKNEPTSSPLARLLAMELNLNLVDIGKGTGKNGKILIADVRKFHSTKLEEARSSIATSGAYFASVSA